MITTKVLIDYDGVVTYVGKALSTAGEDEPKWNIMKIVHDDSGKVISVTYANGMAEPYNIWDDRKSLEYL